MSKETRQRISDAKTGIIDKLQQKENLIKMRKIYYLKNINKIKEQVKKYRLNNVEKIRKSKMEYSLKNKDKLSNYHKIWRENNKEKLSEYFIKNKEKISKNHTRYILDRRRVDIQFKLQCNLRSRLTRAIKNNQKVGSAINDLGCTIDEFKIWIENHFQRGMTWDNWSLGGWHIDHKTPLANFDLTNREQFLIACHYTNLQPMWASDNIKKSNKIL